MIKHLFIILAIGLVLVWLLISQFNGLQFVDAARYADIGRNIFLNQGYISKFTFPTQILPDENGWTVNLPPVYPLLIAGSISVNGINDYSIIYLTIIFSLGSIILTYLIAKHLFGGKTAFVSALLVLFAPQLLNYAKDGGAESLFIFEILLIIHLILLGKRWSILFAGLVAGLMLFTKLQALAVLPVLLIWLVVLHKERLKNVIFFLICPVIMISLNSANILWGFYKYDFPVYLFLQQTSVFPADNLPRTGLTKSLGVGFLFEHLLPIFSKLFYNIYNFYKAIFGITNSLPVLTSGLVVTTYFISLGLIFVKADKTNTKLFRVMSLLLLISLIVMASVTSPHMRYIHPVIPILCILAADFLVKTTEYFFSGKRSQKIFLTSIVLFFAVLPVVSDLVIDQRFRNVSYNQKRPYAHKVLGQVLSDRFEKGDIIVTNLDSWGGWYGDKKNYLIPLDFDQLDKLDQHSRIQAIYLTDFQIDNPDHPLSGDWDKLFNSNAGNDFITDNFVLTEDVVISADQVYERQSYRYKIWIRK